MTQRETTEIDDGRDPEDLETLGGGKQGVRSSNQKEDGARGRRGADPASSAVGGAFGRTADVSASRPAGAPGQTHGAGGKGVREG